MNLTVNLGKQTYTIYIDNGILAHAGEYVRKVFNGQKIMIISDDQVFSYYGEKLEKQLQSQYHVGHVIVKHGEQSKRFDILPEIYHQLLDFHLTRTDTIIALGGGVIGDFGKSVGLSGGAISFLPFVLTLL